MQLESRRDAPTSRDGRVDVGWLVAAICSGGLLAVVFLGWVPARVRVGLLEAQHRWALPVAPDASSVTAAIEKLDQRLARIEAALAVQESRGEREEVKASSIPDDRSPPGARPEGYDQLHNDLQQLSRRVDVLAESWKESHSLSYELPTLEQMRSARRPEDGVFIEDIRKLWFENPSAAFERVRLMSFDDVLAKVGAPAYIDKTDGAWVYNRPGTMGVGLQIRFTRNYVTGVRAVGDP